MDRNAGDPQQKSTEMLSKQIIKWKQIYDLCFVKIKIPIPGEKFESEPGLERQAIGLGGLRILCFASSNPAEVDGFCQYLKILSTSPPGGTLSWGSRVWDFRLVKEPQAEKNKPLSKI